MSKLIWNIAQSIIRHSITSAAGGLVAAGYLSQDDATQSVGAIMLLLGVIWSGWQKRQQQVEVKAALNTPVVSNKSTGSDPEQNFRDHMDG